MTTAENFLEAITNIVTDLPKDVTAKVRYQNLLNNMKTIFPFDSAAVLKLKNNILLPLATLGLSQDAMGRRFNIDEHPRFKLAMDSREALRFACDSDLPDPYDGLIGDDNQHPDVHDCMGISLSIDGKPWGLLTLDALEAGSFDQIDSKQLKTFTKLTEAAVKAAERITALQAKAEHQQLVRQTISTESSTEIIGSCDLIENLKNEISIVAQSYLTVLVLGETGVGKELVARQVHNLSPRALGPLIYVNCAALPENIAESELFGHKKGAFSGAVSDRAGKFEIADGGTLFLDEVGELALSVQAKLLRALQSGEIQRVGSDRYIKMDVRIIAATNRNLEVEVSENRFRSDLFHRLSVYPVHVPALRERGEDILLIAGFLLEQNQKRLGVDALRLTDKAKTVLLGYEWPGNVRELEHTLSRAALKAMSDKNHGSRSVVIHHQHLDIVPAHAANPGPDLSEQHDNEQLVFSMSQDGSLKEAIDDFQRSFIVSILSKNDGNQAAAARDLGVNRSNFYRLLKRLEVSE